MADYSKMGSVDLVTELIRQSGEAARARVFQRNDLYGKCTAAVLEISHELNIRLHTENERPKNAPQEVASL